MRTKIMTTVLASSLTLLACGPQGSTHEPAIPSDKDVEAQVEQALNKLSLDEKIGQMCELTIGGSTDQSVAYK